MRETEEPPSPFKNKTIYQGMSIRAGVGEEPFVEEEKTGERYEDRKEYCATEVDRSLTNRNFYLGLKKSKDQEGVQVSLKEKAPLAVLAFGDLKLNDLRTTYVDRQ